MVIKQNLSNSSFHKLDKTVGYARINNFSWTKFMLMFYIKEHVLEIKFKKSFNLKIEWISFLTLPQIYQLTMFFK
jgi:hypothetical protein